MEDCVWKCCKSICELMITVKLQKKKKKKKKKEIDEKFDPSNFIIHWINV